MLQKFPKVLVVSINAWRQNSGINTLMNLFSVWDPENVAQIYTRSDLPLTDVCTRFFQISESRVLKSVFQRKIRTSCEVKSESEHIKTDETIIQEQKRYRSSGHSSWLKIAREFVWLLGKWKTAELDAFIRDVAPDVLFFPIYPTIYMGLLQLHVLKKTKKPIVSYIADDNYSYRAVKGDWMMTTHRFFLRQVVRRIMEQSEQVFVIAPKQKEEYDRIFGINCEIITKGIDYTGKEYVPCIPHTPIRMVYTGKLIIGRDESLISIAEAMGEVNAVETKLTLDIYTTDQLTEKQQRLLNRNGCTVRGAVSFEEVLKLQTEADILVFAECLKKRYRDAARLSFSTKLTDYLAAGKCIFAVGGNEIAPIDYLEKEDSGITAISEEQILEKLEMIVSNPEMVNEYGRKAFECGRRNHERKMVEEKFVHCMAVAAER